MSDIQLLLAELERKSLAMGRLRRERDEAKVALFDLRAVLLHEAANLRVTDQSRRDIADRMLEEAHAVDPNLLPEMPA